MLKKLFLTGLLAVSTILPTFADDPVYVENGDTCNDDNLGSGNDCTLVAQYEPQEYGITYDCGTGIGGTSRGSVTYGTNYQFMANYCTKQGNQFNVWSCDNGVGNKAESLTENWTTVPTNPESNITCIATWTPNDIDLIWFDGYTQYTNGTSNTCEYGDGVTLPQTPPTKTGYTFMGWRIRPYCDVSNFETGGNIFGSIGKGFYNGVNQCISDKQVIDCQFANNLGAMEWQIHKNHNKSMDSFLRGTSTCVDTAGTNPWNNNEFTYIASNILPGDSLPNAQHNTTNGQYCWCKASNYTTVRSNNETDICNFSSPSWVYLADLNDSENCAVECAYYCTEAITQYDDFRDTLYGIAGGTSGGGGGPK